jgi:phosphatidylglycerophosphatase A
MSKAQETIAVVIATFFGAGKFRYASGTAGSLAALPVIWLVHVSFGPSAVVSFAVVLFFVGVWASKVYIEISGNNDPKPVVIDEVVGQALAISFLPVGIMEYAVAFVFFRIFDVTKIWPANWAEQRLRGGVAVMMDDVVAGLYAGVASLILLRFLQ